MPVACVIGWDPIMSFLSGSPLPSGVCEYDVMGGYRGEPAQLVRCETVDLEVPASAEIVIEGTISDDPSSYEMEGPFGEYHRLRLRPADAAADHEGDLHHASPRPDLLRLARRHAPRLLQREQRDVVGAARRHRLEYFERRRHSRHPRRLRAADHQRRQYPHPDQEALPGPAQADRGGAVGQRAAQYRYKHVIVVEEDIDPADDEQVEWALRASGQCRRRRHRDLSGDFRLADRSVDAVGRSQRRTARHRIVEPRC